MHDIFMVNLLQSRDTKTNQQEHMHYITLEIGVKKPPPQENRDLDLQSEDQPSQC